MTHSVTPALMTALRNALESVSALTGLPAFWCASTPFTKSAGLIALFLYPVAPANGNTLLPFPIDVGVQIRNEVVRYIDVALYQPLRLRYVHGRESLRVAADREI